MLSEISDIINYSSKKKIKETIKLLIKKYPNKVVFSSSLGIEDQVITDIIYKNKLDVEIFTLDTGRLFKETYDLTYKINERYNKKLKVYFPNYKDVEKMTTEKGFFSFYDSIENRKQCCNIRKVEPLKRALKGHKVWITGLRKEQSETRTDINTFEWDENNNIIKYNPLLNWEISKIEKYIKTNQVPINILHNKGFPSIGCQPCTRAIKEKEDLRNGRWWWENKDTKECGLHK